VTDERTYSPFGRGLNLPDEKFMVGPLERRELDELVMGAGEAPDTLNRIVPVTLTNQEGSEACCGHGWAHAMQLRGRFLYGDGFELPAPRPIYDMGRIFEGEPYVDNGTTIGATGEAVSKLGFVRESICPWNTALVDEPLDLDALQNSFEQINMKWHRLLEVGPERRAAVQRLLNAGVSLVIGQRVDAPYMRYSGGLYMLTEKALGGHCTALDFRYDPEGVWDVGSYGESWGVGGKVKIAWLDIEDPNKVPVIAAVDMVRRY
jgi:hypothetical protein